jgi:glutaredoxin
MILYAWEYCSFCKKVVNFIKENNLDIEIIYIEKLDRDKKQEYKKLIKNKVGKFQVPVLQTTNNFIPESKDIIEYLKKYHI